MADDLTPIERLRARERALRDEQHWEDVQPLVLEAFELYEAKIADLERRVADLEAVRASARREHLRDLTRISEETEGGYT